MKKTSGVLAKKKNLWRKTVNTTGSTPVPWGHIELNNLLPPFVLLPAYNLRLTKQDISVLSPLQIVFVNSVIDLTVKNVKWKQSASQIDKRSWSTLC
jgi:hypothetical protein